MAGIQLCAEQTSLTHVSPAAFDLKAASTAASRKGRPHGRAVIFDIVPRDTGPFGCSNRVTRKCKIRMTMIKSDL